MKASFYLALAIVSLLGYTPAVAQDNANEGRAQQLITHRAPIAFLGRPIEGRIYKDATGKEYNSELIEVLQVLRGQEHLHVGFVEIMDSVSTKNTLSLVPNVINITDNIAWGIYFCSLNNVPGNGSAYMLTKNRPLHLFRDISTAHILYRMGEHTDFIGGLSRGFADEQEVKSFLATVPDLAPVSKFSNHPTRYFDESYLRKTPLTPTPQQRRILEHAPIVFFGRPQEGQTMSYTAKGDEHFYNTTLLQVVEVLRGQKLLRPGFVELIDSVPSGHILTEISKYGELSGDYQNWGIYFCSPNSVTRRVPAYKAATQQPVRLFHNKREAAIMSITNSFGHGTFIKGLYTWFANVQALQSFLAAQPTLVAPRKLVPLRPVPPEAEAEYPRIMERIKYKWALSRADSAYIKKYIPQLMPSPRPKPVPQPGNAMSVPIEALPEFPRVMLLIRSNQALSRADSAYIKKYIPSLMPPQKLKTSK